MPRSLFVSHLNALKSRCCISNISDVAPGEEDGSFSFTFTHPTDSSKTVRIQVLVPDLSEYPAQHQCFLYTASEHVHPIISKVIETLSDTLHGHTIAALLESTSHRLSASLSAKFQENGTEINDNEDQEVMDIDQEENDSENADDMYSDDRSVGGWSEPSARNDVYQKNNQTANASSHHVAAPEVAANIARLGQDLRAARQAGFKVGLLGNLHDRQSTGFVSISCRVQKLGISEEAMEAWNMQSNQYLIFLIQYSFGYVGLERIAVNQAALPPIRMHVGLSSRYKPTLTEAISVFTSVSTEKEAVRLAEGQLPGLAQHNDFESIFIGRPLKELLNGRLIAILRIRLANRLDWEGAERLYDEQLGRPGADPQEFGLMGNYSGKKAPQSAISPLVTADHLSSDPSTENLSFPLIGMQFLLRHLVHCTEFCLVCHCRVNETFEAIRPYVCSKPLCLYQYMSLGFGPSLEYEIRSQPTVVDLLISFCYAAINGDRLEDFPTGMSLVVPPMLSETKEYNTAETPTRIRWLNPSRRDIDSGLQLRYKVSFEKTTREAMFMELDKDVSCPVSIGDWIVLWSNSETDTSHCRVADTSLYPVIQLSDLVDCGCGCFPKNGLVPPKEQSCYMNLTIYNQNFDNQHSQTKRKIMKTLLDTLPSVQEMISYLANNKLKDITLANWSTRIPPAALGILRWIIASNRSCILHVNKAVISANGSSEQPVYGMPGWVQFRFAQGAPDKEQRFINALHDAMKRLDLKYPSIFAWHGSPLPNWHGIVREGLNFNRSDHGRAFGNGCYHSLDFGVSSTYSNMSLRSVAIQPLQGPTSWPGSELQVTTAVCLNEIVNAPAEFVSRSPHLVVSQLDWIQTRYLFVKGKNFPGGSFPADESAPNPAYPQDPAYTPLGSSGPNSKIIIPLGVVSRGRRALVQGILQQEEAEIGPPTAVVKGNKKQRLSGELLIDLAECIEQTVDEESDDAASVRTTASDLAALCHGENDPGPGDATGKIGMADQSRIDLTYFEAGALHEKTLPLLKPPRYATTIATQTLQRELQTILKIQNSHPLSELGWYIDPELISNVYQWIVELHSFDRKLPLAEDMAKKGINSVVLEIRFGAEYPMSPPFIRVIRPRFMSFARGGGGHVTAGGAMCMELLTNTGWSAVASIESVLLQVRMAICSTEPWPARLDPGVSMDYAVGEAIEAYIRACRAHGWEVPKDIRDIETN